MWVKHGEHPKKGKHHARERNTSTLSAHQTYGNPEINDVDTSHSKLGGLHDEARSLGCAEASAATSPTVPSGSREVLVAQILKNSTLDWTQL